MGDRQPSKTISQDRRPDRIPANNKMSMWSSVTGEEITIDDCRHPNSTSPCSPCPPREQFLLHPPGNIRARSGSPEIREYYPTSPGVSPRPTSPGVAPRPSSPFVVRAGSGTTPYYTPLLSDEVLASLRAGEASSSKKRPRENPDCSKSGRRRVMQSAKKQLQSTKHIDASEGLELRYLR